MPLRRPPRPVPMTLNLAPMVDVMMCLIIFFLLASRLASAELSPVILPTALAARQIDSAELGARVTITVRRASEDAAEYYVADWDGEQVVERRLQPDDLASLLSARAARARAGDGRLRCVIRADRTVQYRHVERVLRACGLAKVSDVVFGVNQAPGGEAPG